MLIDMSIIPAKHQCISAFVIHITHTNLGWAVLCVWVHSTVQLKITEKDIKPIWSIKFMFLTSCIIYIVNDKFLFCSQVYQQSKVMTSFPLASVIWLVKIKLRGTMFVIQIFQPVGQQKSGTAGLPKPQNPNLKVSWGGVHQFWAADLYQFNPNYPCLPWIIFKLSKVFLVYRAFLRLQPLKQRHLLMLGVCMINLRKLAAVHCCPRHSPSLSCLPVCSSQPNWPNHKMLPTVFLW